MPKRPVDRGRGPEERTNHRISIIASITSPLSLFALIILVIEALLGVFAARASGSDFTVLSYGMVGSLVEVAPVL